MNKNKDKNKNNKNTQKHNKHSNNKRLGSFSICRRARSAADARRVAADASDARWRQTHFRGDARF